MSKDRTKKFSLDVIKLIATLPSNQVCWVIGKQLLKSATSIGANYREACLIRKIYDGGLRIEDFKNRTYS